MVAPLVDSVLHDNNLGSYQFPLISMELFSLVITNDLRSNQKTKHD
jgi:hypothetical protein